MPFFERRPSGPLARRSPGRARSGPSIRCRIAWLMWRAVYLGKLPGLERKVRVLIDWVIELFFPRDIVQTIDIAGPVAYDSKPAARAVI